MYFGNGVAHLTAQLDRDGNCLAVAQLAAVYRAPGNIRDKHLLQSEGLRTEMPDIRTVFVRPSAFVLHRVSLISSRSAGDSHAVGRFDMLQHAQTRSAGWQSG